MHDEWEGAKCCHLIWMTRDGRSWFKIAAAARFCEHAVRHACTTLGWRLDVIAIFPDRIHLLVTGPQGPDRRTACRGLQHAVAHLLADTQLLPPTAEPLWAGNGWCAVLPTALSVAIVRRALVDRLRRHP
jgi:REP element-mobilizing transposase RayT